MRGIVLEDEGEMDTSMWRATGFRPGDGGFLGELSGLLVDNPCAIPII